MHEPNPASADWRSQAAVAYAALDRRDEALALAQEELALARRFGAPRAIGIALRTLGVIGDGLDHLNEAVDVLAASPARLEHARALSDLGIALRHRRRILEAREPLRQALDLAIRCGAAPLAERARTELLIAGVRGPRASTQRAPGGLTARELEVAELLADGLTNADLARTLVISERTAAHHVSSILSKLDLTSRRQVAAWMLEHTT